ncbi:unnamed protein product [Fraxinus pennsylvanica]|uniref:Secreted protein n=1 Tax=Fraxinus pennsylvanica TaxID=56036 RepID=A0AAD2AEP2_9LAMI|nr:unnamed protein product [Fraxinus pennsylvanica]
MSASWICLSGAISAVSAHCSSCPGLFSSSVEGSDSCLSSSAQGFSFNLAHSSRANVCSPSPSVSGAGSASAKRFMQKPPVRPTGFSPTNTVSPGYEDNGCFSCCSQEEAEAVTGKSGCNFARICSLHTAP